MQTLEVKKLHVSIAGKQILHDVSFKINNHELVALVGPNGHGKSSLFLAILGHPRYTIDSGTILFNGQDITSLDTDARARLGLFLAFQTPPEIEGVSNLDYYKSIVRDPELQKFAQFYRAVNEDLKAVSLPSDILERELNVGFSGGEKKRHELLQMLLLKPSFVLLDEIDSGLDVDAIKIVADLIKEKRQTCGMMLISHYSRLYEIVQPSRALLLINGAIAYDGDPQIIQQIEKNGYQDICRDLQISMISDKTPNKVLLGDCAIKKTGANGA